MGKKVDINGFWLIEANPVTKEGVFPYLGSQIDFSGSLGLEPDKIYNVYRPASELEKPETIESFNGAPFIDGHEMLGDGCRDYDEHPAGGVLLNYRKSDTPGTMVADLKILSEALKDSVEGGKKELSLGYRCKYEPTRGVFDGKTYDFTQTGITGNHLALVDKGRMGSEVRVFDSQATVFDSIEEINAIQKGEDAMTDKEIAAEKRKKIGAALDGICSKEEITAVQDMCEPEDEEAVAAKKKAEDEAAEKEAAEKKKAEDEAASEEEKAAEKKKAEDEEAEAAAAKKKEDESSASAEDTFAAIAPIIAARDALVKQVTPLVGAFDHSVMTAKQVAVYACEKLKITCAEDEALPMLKGYLKNVPADTKQFALDAATNPGEDKSLKNYLEGN